MDLNPTSLLSLCLYFIRLGATGFGGPIALTAAMQEDLIDKNNWFSQDTFQEGMALSQLAPGPLAAQMSIYFGWVHSGIFGAALTGLSFILPGFFIVLALSIAYVSFGTLPGIQKAFYGIGASVIALISIGVFKLTKKNLKKDKLLWIIAILNGLITAYSEQELLSIFLFSGFLVLLLRNPPKAKFLIFFPPILWTGTNGPATKQTLLGILAFFTKAGAFIFGSGLAIVPFLHGGVVVENQWLTERQFLDAVAVAMITPGPVVITVAFIGFLVAGFFGSVLACIGTFLPCYFFTVIPAPYFSKWSKNKYIYDFVNGVTAAAIGAIGGAVIILGKKALIDWTSVLICLGSLILLLRFKKFPEQLVILLSGALGLLLGGNL